MQHIIQLPVKLTMLLLVACLAKAVAQPVTNTFDCTSQLLRLRAVFSDTSHLSFNTAYYIRYNNGQRDTLLYSYRTSKNKAHVVVSDSTEIVQNSYYSLLLKHADKRAVLSTAREVFNYIAHANILNNDFNKTFVTGLSISDTGNYKKLSYHFKAASPYKQYDILYDSVTSHIQSIQYCYGAGTSNNPNSKTPFYVTVLFSNYQTGRFTDAVFSTDPYFVRKKGIFYMVAPYDTYTLKNSVNQ